MAIAGYQFRGAGRLLDLVTRDIPGVPHISVETGRLLACVLVIVFTLLAGMVSIVSIDIFNGTLMVLGVLIGLPLALSAVGGWDMVAATVPATHFAVFGQHGPVWAFGVFFPTFFLLLGESSMYQKFFAAKDERSARRAVLGMVVGVVVIETCLALLAVVGAGKYWNLPPFRGPDGTLDVPVTETIILHIARSTCRRSRVPAWGRDGHHLLHRQHLPPDPVTNLARDIYQRFLHPTAPRRGGPLPEDHDRGRRRLVPAGHPVHVLLQMAFTA